jgi:mycothiol synthase
MLRFETCHDLDGPTLKRILGLIEFNTQVDGHSPVGEHKYAHLAVGAPAWTGVLAWTDDDELVGYAHTLWNPTGSRPRMGVEIVVHPDVRADGGVARKLINETRQILAGAGGGLMWLWVHHVADARRTLAFEMGFDVQRELAFMRRDLPERPAVPEPPGGVEIRAYTPDVDDGAFLRVNNAAFADHPENGNWDAEEFRTRRSREWFDPRGLFMAWRGGELLGFHWTKWHAHDSDEAPAHEPVGEVYVLAVALAAQGLGLGRLLLQRGLAHLWDADCRRAMLYVDRTSAGAVKLYESAGFVVAHSEVCYETRVPS